MLRRNVIANFLGSGWVAAMELLFIPVYISYLGLGAFGLVGIFMTLQAMIILLDMGMGLMVNREMARYAGGQHDIVSIRRLLRSLECIIAVIAVSVALGIMLSSEPLAVFWIGGDTLPIETVASAFAVMGLIISLKLFEGIYRGALYGLQRQGAFNIGYAAVATLRSVGAVAVLMFVSPTITAFFLWQVFTSAVSVLLFATLTYRFLPEADRRIGPSLERLRAVWKFAGGVLAISALGTVLVQTDKLVLSVLIDLESFSLYVLAGLIATGLFKIAVPIAQAWYPRMSELHAMGSQMEFRRIFHVGAQLMSVTVASVALTLVFFADVILLVWTNDADISVRVAPIMRVLVFGTMLNSMMLIPYNAQLAYGITSLATLINLVAVLVMVPALLFFVPIYGSMAAAWSWLILNLCFITCGSHLMYRMMLGEEQLHWCFFDIVLPLGASAAVMVGAWFFFPDGMNYYIRIAYVATACVSAMFLSYLACLKWGDLKSPS